MYPATKPVQNPNYGWRTVSSITHSPALHYSVAPHDVTLAVVGGSVLRVRV